MEGPKAGIGPGIRGDIRPSWDFRRTRIGAGEPQGRCRPGGPDVLAVVVRGPGEGTPARRSTRPKNPPRGDVFPGPPRPFCKLVDRKEWLGARDDQSSKGT